ncbi:MAG: hypothetical protein AB7O39_01965 [Flavobacteriaceae bacterium]
MLTKHARTHEIVSGRLFLLGDSVEIDERISWRGAEDHGRYDPINVYLLRERSEYLLVEAGVALFEQTVNEQLSGLIGAGILPRLAVTRNEPDTISNVPGLVKRWNLQQAFTPGVMNPLDYFEDASARYQMISFGVEQVPVRPGDRIAIAGDRVLEAVQTPLRMLSTTWYYDTGAKALFCSDIMTDATGAGREDRIVDRRTGLDSLVAYMKRNMQLRYDWLPRSRLRPIIEGLEALFARYDIDILAPSRGRIVVGREAVVERQQALLAVLRDLSLS